MREPKIAENFMSGRGHVGSKTTYKNVSFVSKVYYIILVFKRTKICDFLYSFEKLFWNQPPPFHVRVICSTL